MSALELIVCRFTMTILDFLHFLGCADLQTFYITFSRKNMCTPVTLTT